MSGARRKLVLASASPRRGKLLHDAGYDFEQVTPPFDDSSTDLRAMPPRHLAAALAYQKAMSVADKLEAGVVMGCDTLLSVDGHAVGKPGDEREARRVLGGLLGRRHEVISAVFLVEAGTGRQGVFVDSADVTIHPPGEERFERYIRSGGWRGKAGGYNLAELEGDWKFDVRGDPTTVIGLPMALLKVELESFAPDLLPKP